MAGRAVFSWGGFAGRGSVGYWLRKLDGGVSVILACGSASAAAGTIPQASAAARPRLRSDPRRFSLMVVLLLSGASLMTRDRL